MFLSLISARFRAWEKAVNFYFYINCVPGANFAQMSRSNKIWVVQYKFLNRYQIKSHAFHKNLGPSLLLLIYFI